MSTPKRTRFMRWLDGDYDLLTDITASDDRPDAPRETIKREQKHIKHAIQRADRTRAFMKAETKGFMAVYNMIAIISCISLIGVLLYIIAYLPRYGVENPETLPVVKRYVEEGIKETGAINVVAGLILDYRAFDTLGESHVLFTALICVMILLRKDQKNMRIGYEDYYKIQSDQFHDISRDRIMQIVGMVLIPCIFVYGIYVLLNGQNGPGGGFSGGAVMGAGLIIAAASIGFERVDHVFTAKVSAYITFAALSFYSFAKGYVFFTGANGLDNHIPKGIPGAIFSGGLILPLDIAVGMVVACTMFGFYSLFRRGNIGGD